MANEISTMSSTTTDTAPVTARSVVSFFKLVANPTAAETEQRPLATSASTSQVASPASVKISFDDATQQAINALTSELHQYNVALAEQKAAYIQGQIAAAQAEEADDEHFEKEVRHLMFS